MKNAGSIIVLGIILIGCTASKALRIHDELMESEAEKVTLCQLAKDPSAYNHKLIEVTAFITHGFEDFTLFDPNCASSSNVWLEYGGTVASGTVYCCGPDAERSRPKPLVVEDVTIPLKEDRSFKHFDKLIQREPDSVVHATIVGRFFAGEKGHWAANDSWGGYGHFGCCSLLVISTVLAVDAQNQGDLDYRANPDYPDPEGFNVGCGFKGLVSERAYKAVIQAQQEAETAECEWRFNDPKRVAIEALAQLLQIKDSNIVMLKRISESQGRVNYQWVPEGRAENYMIVVSKPYLLSFYAKDPSRIAWVPIAVWESSCEKRNPSTPIR